MEKPKAYRITNYMNEKAADTFVAAREQSEISPTRLIAFIVGHASRYTDGAIQLTNDDVGQLLVEFYGFNKSEYFTDAEEVDISMALKDFSFMGRWEPGFEQLLADPSLMRDGLLERVETICDETFESAFG
jgi:hypothetical protein